MPVYVDVENGVRDFRDAEETAKAILKREKLKKDANAQRPPPENPRTAPDFRKEFIGDNNPNGKPTGRGRGYMGKNYDPQYKRPGANRGRGQGNGSRGGRGNQGNKGNGGQ